MRAFTEKILYAYTRWFPIRRGKYRLVERFCHGLNRDFNSMRTAQLKFGGYRMNCDLRKTLQRQFYFFGTYILEEQVLREWFKQAKTAQVVLDVGANAGIFSFAAAASNPTSQIHAFEPTPEIATHFRNTIAQNNLNTRISLHQTAIASETGTAHLNFFTGENLDNEGMNFVTAQARTSASIEVLTISLDDFCARQGLSVVDLIKIDVQGNEADVLAGAKDLLQRKKIKTIFLELNWYRETPSHCPASKVVRILENAGYQFADPRRSLKFRQAGCWMNDLTDVIATPCQPLNLERRTSWI